MQARPRADDLAVDARILDLVAGGAGEMVGGHVADAVAAGLDGMHLDARQFLQNVGHLVEAGPVVLDVLARGEVAVRSEEHTSELQSLMRISYAVFCLNKKNIHNKHLTKNNT